MIPPAPHSARLLALLTGLASCGAAAATLPLTACVIEHPLKLTVVPVECGTLAVAENPAEPQGRRLALHIARVPAINRRKRPEPLFVLAGGPGQGAAAFYASVAGAFGRIHRDRDIVLIDQRGTGSSNALECGMDEDALYQATPAQVAALTERCLSALRPRAAVAYYTTSLAVQDLEQVRRALGYERIDLYGASYGTRVAQHYLRHHEAQVRALILDGVVPPELVIGPDSALTAEAALREILARCAAEAECRQRFADPQADYEGVRAELRVRPVPVIAPDPMSGVSQHFNFGPEQLATVLRLASYASEYAALLPLWLHAARANHAYDALAAQYLLLQRSYEGLAVGMHNSVLCAEDVPLYDTLRIERTRLTDTYMGISQLDALSAICRVWPRGPMDADLHAPLHSAVPVLLLSGSADPVTPPAYARQAAAGFSHAQQLVLQGFGHGQLTAPCMDRLLAQFLEQPGSLLDSDCTRRDRPMPFFTSVNGPPP